MSKKPKLQKCCFSESGDKFAFEFEVALSHLKKGKMLARKKWECCVLGYSYIYLENNQVMIWENSGFSNEYSPSSDDLLSDDWFVIQ